jgi:hypothetical protein
MLALLHYFNTGLLASVEQMKERIAADVTPFDQELESLAGIGSNDAAKSWRELAAPPTDV